MIVEQITSAMKCPATAKRFAEHTTTFIPVIIRLKDGRYAVGKKLDRMIYGDNYIYHVDEEQIIFPDSITESRGRPPLK